jgi:AcrR family transcriptional regulator
MAAITPLRQSGREPRGPGRPRISGRTVANGTAREEILDQSARLFTEHGYSATSTRDIAEACGVRQASLYYHFAGKHEILAVLLGMTVRPSRDKVEQIGAIVPPENIETALYLLALIDIHTLAEAPHNVAILGQLPDVVTAGDGEIYANFQAERHELIEAYTDFGYRLAQRNGARVTSEGLGAMLVQLVEGVIPARAEGSTVGQERVHEIAGGCLRLCGCDQEQIDAARNRAEELCAQ